MRLLEKAAFGAKFRLYMGAVLSMVDLLTDLATIYRFWKQQNYVFAYANLAFIGLSLLLQSVSVIMQNRKKERRVLAYELGLVILMIKPAVDARRVARGDEQVEGEVMNPAVQLASTRTHEMFAESLPSLILQTYALLLAPKVDKSAVSSICVSAMAISFTSATISTDYDCGKFFSWKLQCYLL